mgnify:FL=1
MLYFRYYLTLLFKANGFAINISPDPELEVWWGTKNGGAEVWCWDRSFPLWLAERIQVNCLPLLGERTDFSFRRLNKEIARTTRRYAWTEKGAWVRVHNHPSPSQLLSGRDQMRRLLQKLLPGRELTPAELVRSLARTGLEAPENILELLLHELVLEGRIKRVAGVGLDPIGRFYCRRCGEKERIYLEYLQAAPYPCRVCSSCWNLGTLSDLVPLYSWRGETPTVKVGSAPQLLLPEFTYWQQRAVDQVLSFWQNESARTLLVWAVCGAGKTEVVFPVLKVALSQGKRVLLTVPRREIVRELAERIKQSFPGLDFTILYGGRKEEVPGSLLVVATTHQLLRFAPFFHLVIVDEADAFPLYGNPMLNAALDKVLLPTGKKIYMTATPDASWRGMADQRKIEVAKIPLRYHGHLLPLPLLVRCKLPTRKEWFVPGVLSDFILGLQERNRKALIFLPTVELVEEFGTKLKGYFQEKNHQLAYLHSRDPQREEKIRKFSSGSLTTLFTTTLLERGLNFRGLDVMILYADHQRIFSTETLIQIAGRVGRSAEDPDGIVYFVADTVSPAMKEARRGIELMNKEARKMRKFT